MQLRALPCWKPESKRSRQHQMKPPLLPVRSLQTNGITSFRTTGLFVTAHYECKHFLKEAKSLFAIRHHIATSKVGCRDYWRLLSACIEEVQILPPSSHCCWLVNFIFISLQLNPLARLFLKHRKRYQISICVHQVRTLRIPPEWGWNKKEKKWNCERIFWQRLNFVPEKNISVS